MKYGWKQASVFVALLLPLLIVGVDTAVSARAEDGGIQWLSYAEGRQRGEAENKKVFLVFNADWCRYCLKMEKETFQDPSVIAYVNRNFVPINVNSDKEQAVADKFNVRGLPSTWFISENGDRIGSRPGFIPADEMLQILKFIGSDSYRSMNFQTFLKKNQ
ncbi:thioredoxin family protein [uncultured Desulfosarcina sp.]|uniref:thioredoxin family protein n=1 Tax=uncultured Desulfosarcina sp. TaxID=218289 RepID=UPI0029C838E2|nr:thioredoxin family protein [uncultured Desulfosarcina sp.]